MKTIFLILIYIGTFIGLFCLLSIIGLLWTSYKEVLAEPQWIISYSLFMGWWVAALPATEYYSNNKTYFDKVFE